MMGKMGMMSKFGANATSVFDPTQYGTLIAWYDCTNAANMEDSGGDPPSAGEDVAVVTDLSGNANHLDQRPGTGDPSFSSGALLFDSANNEGIQTDTNFSTDAATTAFMVLKRNGGGTGSFYMQYGFDNTFKYALRSGAADATETNLYLSADVDIGTMTDETLYCVTMVNNGASTTGYINTTQGATGNPGGSAANALTFGGFDNGGSFIVTQDFYLYEFVLYDAVLSEANIASVQADLIAKHGI